MVLDPFGGLAGDMLLGALLDLAPDRIGWLREQLASLRLPDWELNIEPAERRHIGCTRATFRVPAEQEHRHLPEIIERIRGADFPARAALKAIDAFEHLAQAEARVHRIAVDQVHFHEVGAADAVLDICGCSLLLDALGVEKLLCGPLPGGSGLIHCEHGDLPCPAPAVVELLVDFVLLVGVGAGEMVTPTGAALLRAWGSPLAGGPPLSRARAGYGAGTRESSICRVILGRCAPDDEFGHDEIAVLETHLDDESPEHLGWLSERLFELGVLDVAFAPVTMKKGRPAVALTVMSPPRLRSAAIRLILRESTALGVREQLIARTMLTRHTTLVSTAWGDVRIKWAGGRPRPEYDDVAALARMHDVALHEIEQAALALAHEVGDG